MAKKILAAVLCAGLAGAPSLAQDDDASLLLPTTIRLPRPGKQRLAFRIPEATRVHLSWTFDLADVGGLPRQWTGARGGAATSGAILGGVPATLGCLAGGWCHPLFFFLPAGALAGLGAVAGEHWAPVQEVPKHTLPPWDRPLVSGPARYRMRPLNFRFRF